MYIGFQTLDNEEMLKSAFFDLLIFCQYYCSFIMAQYKITSFETKHISSAILCSMQLYICTSWTSLCIQAFSMHPGILYASRHSLCILAFSMHLGILYASRHSLCIQAFSIHPGILYASRHSLCIQEFHHFLFVQQLTLYAIFNVERQKIILVGLVSTFLSYLSLHGQNWF